VGDCQTNIVIIIPTNTPNKPVKYVKIGPGHYKIGLFEPTCRFFRIATKGVIVNSINSGVSGLNVTKIVHNVDEFILSNNLKLELQYCNAFRNGSAITWIGQ